MIKFTRSLMVLALGFGALTATARAGFVFDPSGTTNAGGNAATVEIIDPSPGNALAVGVIPPSTTGPTSFRLLYQAVMNLGGLENSGGLSVAFPGLLPSGIYYTVVSGFNELGTALGTPTASFSTNTDQTGSYFRIYAHTNAADINTLAGTGYASGTRIYEGTVLRDGSGSFTLATPQPTTLPPLDNDTNGNQYSGITSVVGNGSSQITVATTFADTRYFITPVLGFNLRFNTSNLAPFGQVEPNGVIYNGFTNTTIPAAQISSIGAINGVTGPNFLFQADGNGSINAIPEPSTLVSVAMAAGMMGLGLVRRMRRNQSAK